MKRLLTRGSGGIKILLQLSDLSVRYRIRSNYVHAVNHVSLTINRGETLGLVGESGCGKTTVLKAIARLLPINSEITGGEVFFEGRDLLHMSVREMRQIRWKEISIITQSAMNALDPVYRVGNQIAEAIQTHEKINRGNLLDRIVHLFEVVGLESKRMDSFPHQLSGGMRQRVIIAMALALNPKLVIADEPTTALDVITQDHIINKIMELQQTFHFAIIYVTHDISVVAETCNKVAVMYAGRILEYGSRDQIFEKAFHPYTLGLQNAFPALTEDKKLISIPGFPPDLASLPGGCVFSPRCPFRVDHCMKLAPPLKEVAKEQFSACLRADQIDSIRERAKDEKTWQG
jgi:oligopeptide/dipeptide ABC transporter ATP-binding protein